MTEWWWISCSFKLVTQTFHLFFSFRIFVWLVWMHQIGLCWPTQCNHLIFSKKVFMLIKRLKWWKKVNKNSNSLKCFSFCLCLSISRGMSLIGIFIYLAAAYRYAGWLNDNISVKSFHSWKNVKASRELIAPHRNQ